MGFFDDEADEELEDEFEDRTGYSMFELERMSRAERNCIIEKARLRKNSREVWSIIKKLWRSRGKKSRDFSVLLIASN